MEKKNFGFFEPQGGKTPPSLGAHISGQGWKFKNRYGDPESIEPRSRTIPHMTRLVNWFGLQGGGASDFGPTTSYILIPSVYQRIITERSAVLRDEESNHLHPFTLKRGLIFVI